ncbi:MAG: SlyX family protein [Neisseria sp.]|nr:SlyX family protein [Neisseria sp.]
MSDLENRVIELEIQLALQEEWLQSLNDTVAKLNNQLDLQQAQLRLLYQKTQDKGQDDKPYSLADEIPPHY